MLHNETFEEECITPSPTCHRKQQILVIRNRRHAADFSFVVLSPQRHTSFLVVVRAFLNAAICRAWCMQALHRSQRMRDDPAFRTSVEGAIAWRPKFVLKRLLYIGVVVCLTRRAPQPCLRNTEARPRTMVAGAPIGCLGRVRRYRRALIAGSSVRADLTLWAGIHDKEDAEECDLPELLPSDMSVASFEREFLGLKKPVIIRGGAVYLKTLRKLFKRASPVRCQKPVCSIALVAASHLRAIPRPCRYTSCYCHALCCRRTHSCGPSGTCQYKRQRYRTRCAPTSRSSQYHCDTSHSLRSPRHARRHNSRELWCRLRLSKKWLKA